MKKFLTLLSLAAVLAATPVFAGNYVEMRLLRNFDNCDNTSTPISQVDSYVSGHGTLNTNDTYSSTCHVTGWVEFLVTWTDNYPALTTGLATAFNDLRAYVNGRTWPTMNAHENEFYYGEEDGGED